MSVELYVIVCMIICVRYRTVLYRAGTVSAIKQSSIMQRDIMQCNGYIIYIYIYIYSNVIYCNGI